MGDALLNALERNLAQAEALGQTERAKALKGRISERGKELVPKPAPAPAAESKTEATSTSKKGKK